MKTYSISELTQEFNVSTRTIRYYEELGILNPQRSVSGQRVYVKKDRVRLRLIFRGKKFGFSLAEIKEMIGLFDIDPSGKMQLEKTMEYGKQKLKEIDERIEELLALRNEIQFLYDNFHKTIQQKVGKE
ncbi:MerR family transcriptional regulator [Aneurinibacillus aneurinilyticus]|uniref:MerR family transcriptional regulator n=1 Tax=Aneurinibacillus aneurinilyticus TaxID=1391 RepID=UPI00352610B9